MKREREEREERRARRFLIAAGVCFGVFWIMGGMFMVYVGVEEVVFIILFSLMIAVVASLLVLAISKAGLSEGVAGGAKWDIPAPSKQTQRMLRRGIRRSLR